MILFQKNPSVYLAEDELGTHAQGKYALTNGGTENAPVYKIQSVEEDTNTDNSYYDHVFADGSVQIDVTNSSQAAHLLSEVSSLEFRPHVQTRPTPSASNEMPDNGAIIQIIPNLKDSSDNPLVETNY